MATQRFSSLTIWTALALPSAMANQCPNGYQQLGHTGADVPDWGMSPVGHDAEDMEDCAAQCSADSQCGDFEWNQNGDSAFPDACALNSWSDSTKRAETGYWHGSITCKKVVCPRGYAQLGDTGADVPDWGMSPVGNDAEDMEDCAAQCGADSQCGDFEWNQHGDSAFPDACALNSWSDSTETAQTGKWPGSITCKKLSSQTVLLGTPGSIPVAVCGAAVGVLAVFVALVVHKRHGRISQQPLLGADSLSV